MARQTFTENRLVLRRRQQILDSALPTSESVTVDLTGHRGEPGDDGINLPTWLRRTPSSRKRPLFERWRE